METHPLLPPGGKDLACPPGLCKQPSLHNVFLTALFLHTGNNPINFIISAEEGQGYRFALKFNELSTLLKGNHRAEELTALWETFSEQGPAPAEFHSEFREGDHSCLLNVALSYSGTSMSSLQASVSLILN